MKFYFPLSLKILVCFILTFHCFFSYGNNKIEDLKDELKRASNGYDKMQLCVKLSNQMRYEDTKQSIEYMEQAIKLVNDQGTATDNFNYQFKLGSLHIIDGNFAKGVEINTSILETSSILSDSLYLGIHNVIALGYHGLGEFHLAIKYGKKAIQLGESFQLSELAIPSIGCLAKINTNNGNYDEALAYFQKALQESIKKNRYIQKAYITKDLAELYFYRGESQLGIEAAQKSISTCKKYNLYIIENDALINLSWLYRQTNQLDKALSVINKVIDFLSEKKHAPLLIKAKDSKALILSQMDKMEEALDLALNTLAFAKEKKLQKQVIQSNETIAKLYGKKEDYKNAYYYQNEARQIKNQLLKEEKAKVIKLAEDNAEIETKDISAKIAETNLYHRLTTTFGYSLAIILWIALVLIMVFWRFGNNSFQPKFIIPNAAPNSSDFKYYMAQKISFWSFLMLLPITFHFYYWDVKGLLYSSFLINLMFIGTYFLAKKKNMKGIFYASLTPYFICAIAPLFASNLHSIPIAIVATFIINCFLIPQRFYLIVNVFFGCISTIFYLYHQSTSTSAHIPFSAELDLLITLFGIILIVVKVSFYYNNLRKLNQQVFNNNDFLRKIADINPHFIFTKNKNREFTFVNEALAKVYQLDKDKVIGKKDEDFNPQFSTENHFKEDDLQVLNNGVSIINRDEMVFDLDGKEIWLQTTKKPIFDANNNIIGLIGIANNITDKKKAELRVIESEARYRKLFDYSFDGLFIIDQECNIEECNNNVIEFLQCPNKEILLGQNLSDLFSSSCKPEVYANFLASEELVLPIKTASIENYFGEKQKVEFTIMKIVSHDNTQLVCTIKDISEKIALEEKEKELIQKQLEIHRINEELVAQTMSENQQNKFLDELKKNITSIIPDVDGNGKMKLNKLVRKIGNAINTEDNFYQFKLKFQKSHPDFFEKLNQINPQLTPTDLKISAYIRLGLSAEDMANLLAIEKKSVEMAKYRLKKKIYLNKEENLNTFILTL